MRVCRLQEQNKQKKILALGRATKRPDLKMEKDGNLTVITDYSYGPTSSVVLLLTVP